MVKNTDDHLRNHGFLLKGKSWILSPLYDVNTNKDGKYLSLNIDENNSYLDTDILVDTSEYYGITKDEGNKMIKNMKDLIV